GNALGRNISRCGQEWLAAALTRKRAPGIKYENGHDRHVNQPPSYPANDWVGTNSVCERSQVLWLENRAAAGWESHGSRRGGPRRPSRSLAGRYCPMLRRFASAGI